MFEGTEKSSADHGQVRKTSDSEVRLKQLSSTPIDHHVDELHCPPVGSAVILRAVGEIMSSFKFASEM